MDECEKKKKLCKKINLQSQKALIDQARKKNCFLVYLSSSRVFKGKGKTPSEKTKPKPFNFYGKLKHNTELYIRQKHPNSAILRLTKVFDAKSLNPIKLVSAKPIYKSSKIRIAPISIQKTVQILIKILEKNKNGVFHFSSKNSVSSYEFYRYFNKKTQMQNHPKTKAFWGNNPLLSMQNTKRILNVKQETWQKMLI